MISVEEAVEELLSEGGPCVHHRYKIIGLLISQEAKIIELSGQKCVVEVEPPRPINCANCDTTYDACTKGIFKANGKACCSACADSATHDQDDWENYIRNNKEKRI